MRTKRECLICEIDLATSATELGTTKTPKHRNLHIRAQMKLVKKIEIILQKTYNKTVGPDLDLTWLYAFQ